MVARIAPSPLSSTVAIGDAYSHAQGPTGQRSRPGGAPGSFAPQNLQSLEITLPPPAPPPGEAFAAALIAGQLPPVPVTREELRQRLGATWEPPSSALRLMDRSA
jgi:hypothetical protein